MVFLYLFACSLRAYLVDQMVKNLCAMQETWVQPLGREDPLEKGMVIHSSILTCRIPWTEEPGRLQSRGSQRVGQTEHLTLHFSLSLRKAFLSLLAIFWNSAFKRVYLSFSPLPFTSLLFSVICKASSDNHFAFLHFFFLGMVFITPWVKAVYCHPAYLTYMQSTS